MRASRTRRSQEKIDRGIVVKNRKAGPLFELSRYRQLSGSRRAMQEYELHAVILFRRSPALATGNARRVQQPYSPWRLAVALLSGVAFGGLKWSGIHDTAMSPFMNVWHAMR